MDKQQQADRGDRAKRLLENELLKEAFDEIERVIEEGWKDSAGHEHEQRQNAYLMHRLLQNFKGHFEQLVRTGDHARKELLKLKEKE